MLRALPRHVYALIGAALLIGNIVVWRAAFASRALAVRELSAGKGVATLVRTPQRATILIDTGSDASILRALGTALPFYTRRIDVVVLTSDHVNMRGGLPFVLSRYNVGAVARAGDRITINGAELRVPSR